MAADDYIENKKSRDEIERDSGITDEMVESVFSGVANAVSKLAKDMTAVLRIYGPSVFMDERGSRIYDAETWKNSVYGRIFDKYLNYNPHAEYSIQDLMKAAEKNSSPELAELCRIEKALTYILACLSVITGPDVSRSEVDNTSGFPFLFKEGRV